jgi:hypothetical protein
MKYRRLTNETNETVTRGAGVALLSLLAALSFSGAGCGGAPPAPHTTNDAGATNDGAGGAGARTDAHGDQTPGDAACKSDSLTKKTNGQSCSCAADCTSNFCVDGLCCASACTETCKTCSAPGSMGVCTFLSAGAKPPDASTCPVADPTTCGWDGTCDGAGACRRYTAGTQCGQGMCQGDAVVGARSCDGAGRCRSGPEVICAPFSCNAATGACYGTCTQSSQCVMGQACVAASCGKKMKGATCVANGDCESGFCADGVCCNVACGGGCVSCALPGRLGTCWPVDQGVPDPRTICKDMGAASCGTTGACDGFGGCEKYAAETQCIAPSCTGTRRNTPGTCDGVGSCRPPGVQNCSPFQCVDGACNKVCLSDADCDTGHACVKGLCGPKQNGQPCSAGTECNSTHCVDGICCDMACAGGCRSCALPSAPGKCTLVAAGNVDPRGVCTDMTAASCSANGRCDGAGGCQKYKMGTICAPESCAANVYVPPSTCSATGQCVAPDALPCSPYVCNGTACFNACTLNTDCLTPNVCTMNSCGTKGGGASCSTNAECTSTFCAQGVCCDKACGGACQSCALPGTLGTCTNVPTNASDPAGVCQDTGAAGCGTNGKCQAGACQKYVKGTACQDSTCPTSTTTFTPGSTCDGVGACVTPGSSSCFPYRCGTSVCKGSCAADADCATPAVCIAGSCGLKGPGKTCADGTECLSKFCAQGVCCNSACNGTCQSCALPASMGVCGSVPNGAADPQGTCQNAGPATCDTDGACDGKGACRLYAAGTQCVAPSCALGQSTLTQARTCDGVGNCQAPATIPCAPFLCNGTSACNAACTADTDCLAPAICDPKTNLCGDKKRLGQTCTQTTDCLTGNFCVDGVCCMASMCGTCMACNVVGKAGTCANVNPGDVEPHALCTASPPCGNTGNCNGMGACELASSGVSCGVAACAGSTVTPISHCTGAGACATPTTGSCSPYVCGVAACKTTCAGDGDCVPPFTCQGTAGSMSCALKKNGLACTAFGQCISGNCVDGVCCGTASCLPCQACNLSGTGVCAPVAAGTPAPASFCSDQGATSCGTNGKCDGAGACQPYPTGTSCSQASCPAGASSLTLAGTCQGGVCAKPTSACAPYFCNGVNACQTMCGSDTDCQNGSYCTGVGGACVPTKANGQSCGGGDQCTSTFCVDGVCCNKSSCGSCEACNLSGTGVCAPIAAGTVDPNGTCTDQGATSCGTNGKCDGAGACQKYSDGTICSSATCTSTATLQLAGKCGGGACGTTSQACAPFLCTAGACANTCNTDLDCAGGTYCSGPGGTCVAKKSNGVACNPALPNQCAFGNCVDGVCCNSACTGACMSCAVAGAVGACSPVGPGSADPRGVCKDLGVGACATNGLCDGAGACQIYAPATTCSMALCPAGSASITLQGTCATGSCAASTQPCPGNLMCGANNACATACTTDLQCVPGYFCGGGACVQKKDLGKTCGGPNECGSGNCVDGVCCFSASCGQCSSCALPTSLGTCTQVGAGTLDPSGTCVNQGSIGCGTTGACDNNGACAFQDGSTICATATCSGASQLTSTRVCDGAGTCLDGTITNCGAFACDPSVPACFTTCADDTSCSPPNTCQPDGSGGTSCAPPPPM